MFFGLVILWSTIWLANGALRRPLHRLGRLAAMTVMLGVLLNLGDGGVSPALHKGAIGAAVASALVSAVGYWPSLVLVWAVTFASLLLATDFFFQESFERMLAPARESSDDDGVETVAADGLRDARANAAADAPAPAVVDSPADPAPSDDDASWRRRSWHERRAEREAMASRWSGLAGATEASDPAAESARDDAAMDGIGLSAARVVEAIDAAARDDDAVEPSTAEALQGAGEHGFAGEAPAPVAAARTPIVFPDEAVAPAPSSASDDGWPQAPAVEATLPAWLADGPAADPVAQAADADANAAAPASASTPADEPMVEATASTRDELELGLAGEVFVLADSTDEAARLASPGEGEDSDLTTAVEADAAHESAPAAEQLADASDEPPAVEEQVAAPAAVAEPAIAIPRPEATAPTSAGVDDGLVREAIELVTATRRANTVFLQRKLRVDYDVAAAVLAELAARGVVALDAEATHGRVLV
jgi:hypothetical protein